MLLTRTTGPVALGSPAGCAVRPDPRLLWPHLRLCRPPGGLCILPPGLRDRPANRRGSPIYSARPFLPCRHPYSGGPRDCFRRCLRREFRLRRFRIGSATTSPTFPDRVGRLTKLQRSLDATAWRDCLPRSGQGFYDRACLGRVTPDTQVGYDWMAHRHLPSPDLHRLDGQPYGLRPKETKRCEKLRHGCQASATCHRQVAPSEISMVKLCSKPPSGS